MLLYEKYPTPRITHPLNQSFRRDSVPSLEVFNPWPEPKGSLRALRGAKALSRLPLASHREEESQKIFLDPGLRRGDDEGKHGGVELWRGPIHVHLVAVGTAPGPARLRPLIVQWEDPGLPPLCLLSPMHPDCIQRRLDRSPKPCYNKACGYAAARPDLVLRLCERAVMAMPWHQKAAHSRNGLFFCVSDTY